MLVLSDERGVLKPDPRIFEIAVAELGADPARTVMVGDNPDADGRRGRASVAPSGSVAAAPDRPADSLLRAVSDQ